MDQTLTVSLIQTPLFWEDKKANLNSLEEKIFSIKETTEVVILPEMFSTGFSMNPETLAEKMDGETVEWMKKIALQRKIILTGSVIIEEDGYYHNRLIWMLPNGQFGIYNKRHRFGYAGENDHYREGVKRLIASVKGWKLNLQICYDLRFPVWSRQTPGGNAEYDILIYVANWPSKRIHAWKTLLAARAIENQCYVIGVNRTGEDPAGNAYSGDSAVIDPLGEILWTGNEDSVHTITLSKKHLDSIRDKYPFLKDADEFKIVDVKE